MSSSSSSSSSVSALATVSVTARDIEFSNYNSVTGKWGNAIVTMMIEDTVTPDNLNMQVYDEKVYAVFRNHDDPTDLIEFSPEVDGMDFRVTTSDPMTPSAKYELYKVYGEDSGGEYATTSQFYIQVPGKEWDFANDTVGRDDITLVSDWFNYGYVEDTNGNKYGAVTQNEMATATVTASSGTFTINGQTLSPNDIQKVKLTSLNEGMYGCVYSPNFPSYLLNSFCRGWDNVTDIDIVSSRITSIGSPTPLLSGGFRNAIFDKKFAFPNTLTSVWSWFYYRNAFNKPLYFPDSVEKIHDMFMSGSSDNTQYTSKIRFSPNTSSIDQSQNHGSFYNMTNWAGTRNGLAANVQLGSLSNYNGTFYTFAYTSWTEPFPIPSVWTSIPSDFFRNYNQESEFTVPNNIIQINARAFSGAKIEKITFPSTLRYLSDALSVSNTSSYGGLILENLENTAITNLTQGFLSGNSTYVNMSKITFPAAITTYPNDMLSKSWVDRVWADKDNDGYFTYNIPNGVRTIGNNFLKSCIMRRLYDHGTYGAINKIVAPSSVTSIKPGFCGNINSSKYSTPRTTYAAEIDFSNVSPSVFQDNDTTSFAAQYNTDASWYEPVKIIIAQGTSAAWAAKLPDITTGSNKRQIVWEEKTS